MSKDVESNGGTSKQAAPTIDLAGAGIDAGGEEACKPGASASNEMKFGGGLLPGESQAEAKPLFSFHTKFLSFDLGIIYMTVKSETLGASASMGIDMDMKELKNPLFYRGVLMEFFATFLFLFFTISAAVFRGNFGTDAGADGGAPNTLMIGMSFGFMIFLMVYFAAPVSGGHINPAVSVGLMITRKVTFIRALLYIGAQMAGACAGAALVKALSPSMYADASGGMNAIADGFTRSSTLGAEVMGTGLLMFVVAATVDPSRAASNIHIATLGPFAIGMAVFMAHLSLIPIDGCSINPARSFGPAAVVGDWTDQGVFWGGPIAGAIVGSLIYELFFKGQKKFEDKWSHND